MNLTNELTRITRFLCVAGALTSAAPVFAHVVDGVRANVGGEGTLKIIRESIRCPQVLRAEFTTNLRVLSGYSVVCFFTI